MSYWLGVMGLTGARCSFAFILSRIKTSTGGGSFRDDSAGLVLPGCIPANIAFGNMLAEPVELCSKAHQNTKYFDSDAVVTEGGDKFSPEG